MESKERYVPAQKIFLKLKASMLTQEENEMLRILLLPRNHYFPETLEEREKLAKEILKGDTYLAFSDFRNLMSEKFADAGEWCRGRKDAIMFYRFRSTGRALCSVHLITDNPVLEIILGEKECKKFERERSFFPRDGIQWTYDYFGGETKTKTLLFSLCDRDLWKYYIRLIQLKVESGS